jgi:hypothetical protein
MSATYVARLWLPDIPGTLGSVAAAIGRAGGDVIGIEILERGAGMAIDELLIALADPQRVDALISEVAGVPGVNVEDVHEVDPDRRDQSILALDVAARIVETPVDDRLPVACSLIKSMLEAEWCTVVGRHSPDVAVGTIPDPAWLRAFLEGIRHLDGESSFDHTPGDVAWAPMQQSGFIVCGRQHRAFRSRERHHLALIVRIVDSSLR